MSKEVRLRVDASCACINGFLIIDITTSTPHFTILQNLLIKVHAPSTHQLRLLPETHPCQLKKNRSLTFFLPIFMDSHHQCCTIYALLNYLSGSTHYVLHTRATINASFSSISEHPSVSREEEEELRVEESLAYINMFLSWVLQYLIIHNHATGATQFVLHTINATAMALKEARSGS